MSDNLAERIDHAVAQALLDLPHGEVKHPEVCSVCEFGRRIRAALPISAVKVAP